MEDKPHKFRFLKIDDDFLVNLDLSGFAHMKHEPLWECDYIAQLFNEHSQNIPVALLSLQVSKETKHQSFFLRYVETSSDFKGKGYGVELFGLTFNHLANNFQNCSFHVEGVTISGEKKLNEVARIVESFPQIKTLISREYF